jgi:carbon-monoxide dehydrogenase medium subunit
MIKLAGEGSPVKAEAATWALMRMTGAWSQFDIRAELKKAGVYDEAKVVVNAIQVPDAPKPTYTSADVLATIPALAQVADGIGDPAVRSRGTLGGSLGLNDPAACYPAAVLGLGATVHTNRRTIAADGFFKGLYETALDAGELITAVEFPVPEQAAWMKFKQPASRFSLVGVFVSRGPAGVRVAVTGAGACAFRVPQLEAALSKSWSAAACEGVKVSADGLNTDLHASAAYRAHLITVLARRAVTAAG